MLSSTCRISSRTPRSTTRSSPKPRLVSHVWAPSLRQVPVRLCQKLRRLLRLFPWRAMSAPQPSPLAFRFPPRLPRLRLLPRPPKSGRLRPCLRCRRRSSPSRLPHLCNQPRQPLTTHRCGPPADLRNQAGNGAKTTQEDDTGGGEAAVFASESSVRDPEATSGRSIRPPLSVQPVPRSTANRMTSRFYRVSLWRSTHTIRPRKPRWQRRLQSA